MQKTSEREQAQRLRAEHGLSVKEIARTLGISQSSASNWVRDVELTESQRESLVARARASRNRSRSQHFRQRRSSFQEHGRLRARRGDPGYVAGCMLYWAEGSKSRNAAQFVNSDPAMVRFFVDFMRREYAVPDAEFRIDCNLFADHLERQSDIEQFWLDTLKLPQSCLRKSTVNVYSKHSQKKRQNKLPYGTVRVVVHSTAVVQSIYGAIQEYGGFDRPEWLG
jgi:DNA-binding CsgD family transcriptional regulator